MGHNSISPMQRFLLLACLLACLVAGASARKSLVTGNTISNRFLGYNEQEDKFYPGDYAAWAGEQGAVVIVLGVLFLLFIPVDTGGSRCGCSFENCPRGESGFPS